MKLKKIQTNKKSTNPNWAEDDLLESPDNISVSPEKKNRNSKKTKSSDAIMEKPKNLKTDKKLKKSPKKGSGDENYGRSLDKLKEIDPEFYKVKQTIFHGRPIK